MSVLPPFDLVRPLDLAGALEAISAEHLPYAGGTELLLAMREGLLRPSSLVDLKRVPELSGITEEGGRVLIGGTVTHRDAARSEEVRSSIPVLTEVLEKVGSPRVRAVGTLGGNLCFAEPKSDVATILIALGAEVALASREGRRTLPVAEFLVGPYTTALEGDELLLSISVPMESKRRVVYEKFQTMERPTVAVAAVQNPDGSRRLVIGAAGGQPEAFDLEAGAGFSDIASRVEVIPDLTGGERYKRHIVSILLKRSMERLENGS